MELFFMCLSDDLKDFLISEGAFRVGFADLTSIPKVDRTMPYGVSIMLPVPLKAIEALKGDIGYYDEVCIELDHSLDVLGLKCEEYLKSRGFNAFALTFNRVLGHSHGLIPHKTIATSSGLGWIGKSSLLITPDFGPGVVLTSVYTDAPLVFDKPVTGSFCGKCSKCVDVCKLNAIYGCNWDNGKSRDDLINYPVCKDHIIKSNDKVSLKLSACGECLYVCSFNRKLT